MYLLVCAGCEAVYPLPSLIACACAVGQSCDHLCHSQNPATRQGEWRTEREEWGRLEVGKRGSGGEGEGKEGRGEKERAGGGREEE